MLSDDKLEAWLNGHDDQFSALPWNLEYTQTHIPTPLPFDPVNGSNLTDSTYSPSPRFFDIGYPTTADMSRVFQIVGSPNLPSSLTDFGTPEAPWSTSSHVTNGPLFGRAWTVFPTLTNHLGSNYVLRTRADVFIRTPYGEPSSDALSPEHSSDGDWHQSHAPPLHDLERNLTHNETLSQTLVEKRYRPR